MSFPRKPLLGLLSRGYTSPNTSSQLVGISFDVQDTLIGYKNKRRVGDAYLACANKYLKEECFLSQQTIDKVSALLPTPDQIIDRFRVAYKAGINKRRKSYSDAINHYRSQHDTQLDSDVCWKAVIRHSALDTSFDEGAVPFGGFSSSEAESDWIEVLCYIFGQPATGNVSSSSSNSSSPALDEAILRPLAQSIYNTYGTPFPFELLASTRRTLLSLRVAYPKIPIATVTNNDERVVGLLDKLQLFSQEEVDNGPNEDIAMAQELMKVSWASTNPITYTSLTVGDLIDVIVTPSVTGAAKPHSAPLREAIWQCESLRTNQFSASKEYKGDLKRLDDTSLPEAYKGWIHVGDHTADKLVAGSIPNCSFVWCSPTSGPTFGNIEYCLQKHGIRPDDV